MTQYLFDEIAVDIDTDISIRANVDAIIYGTNGEQPRGIFAVLQSVLRDDNNSPITSPFTYKSTGEGKDGNRGPNTTRTGYLCNEKLIRTIYRPASLLRNDESMSDMGVFAPDRDIFYLSSKDEIYEQDVIVLINTDEDGNIINPVTAIEEYTVTQVYPKRLDTGRIEYYVCLIEDQR